MMKSFDFSNQGQSLIGIIIVFIAVGLIIGGLYLYFSKQIPEVPEITKKLPTEEKIVTPPPEKKAPSEEVPSEEVKSGISCQNECSQAGLKKCSDAGYQTCGNYDVDDCLEWGSTTACPSNYICQNGECINIQQKCTDGTPYSQCSINKPFYCDNGKIISNCTICGCPIGQQCQNGGCVIVTIECKKDQDCDDGNEKTVDRCEQFSESLIKCTHRLGLIGNTKIAIVEFEAKDINYADNFLENINNKTIRKIPWGPYKDPWSGKEFTESIFSFYYLENFLEQEAQRYGKNIDVSVDIFGPYTVSQSAPQRKGTDACDPIMGDYFDQQVANISLNLSGYDAIAFVYFSNGGNAFYSCRGKYAYTAVGWVELEGKGFTSDAILTLFHEIVHLFGASDSYKGFTCSYPDGFVEPNKSPLYPQLEGCLMCGSIPIAEKSVRGPADISEIKICPKTAEEIGWK